MFFFVFFDKITLNVMPYPTTMGWHGFWVDVAVLLLSRDCTQRPPN